MSGNLALPADQIRALAQAASEVVASYYDTIASRPVLGPVTSQAIRAALREPLPRDPTDFAALLTVFEDVILRYSRHSAHPRFFGFIASPGAPAAAMGQMLSATLNTNVTSWRSAPAATEMEHLTMDWLKEMLGYPADAAGLYVSGGSMANFAGLAAARSAKCPEAVRQGVAAAGRRLRVYVSEEAHQSMRKAAGMLGMGEENVRLVATDDRLRMDVADLERVVAADVAAGHLPTCVSASLGTTPSGAVDPIGEIAAVARRYSLWLHVDAAYGGFAALAPSCRPFFEHIAEADSVTLDPHKWLYLPIGCGCILYKDPAAARAAFSHDAEYLRVIGRERDEAFPFWDYGPELSRPFRALDVWLMLKSVGTRALGEAIETSIACAKYLERLVQSSADFEMLAPVELSVFCFRYAPPGFTGDLDALNQRIMVDLQKRGSSYLSNARIRGKFALRGCVLNYRTTERDMETLLDDVRQAAAG
jgi:glutamate/tyrosine decarboxylase-like PLP-dependent enzyme